MSDLRRFPVSDEFISYRQTLDSVCDRMNFFEFSSSHFSRKWDIQLTKSAPRVVFAEDLDVSGHSAPARPPIDPGPVPSAQKKFALHC